VSPDTWGGSGLWTNDVHGGIGDVFVPSPIELWLVVYQCPHSRRETPAVTPQVHTPPAKPAMLQEMFALEEGPVTLTFPPELSATSYQDLADYLAIFLRKVKRKADRMTAAGGRRGSGDGMHSFPS